MPTVELFKDGDRVIVDVGSEPEVVWRTKGYSEKGSKKVQPVEILKEPEVVQEVVEQGSGSRVGRPKKG